MNETLTPSPSPAAPPSPSLGDALSVALGLLLAGGGVVLGLGLVALGAAAQFMGQAAKGATGADSIRQMTMAGLIFLGLGILLGVPLAATALWQSATGRPVRFNLGPWWLWLAAWPVMIGIGQLLIAAGAPAGVFGVVHFITMALPPLVLAAWLAGRLAARGVTWRSAWLYFASGATLSTFLALVLELAGGAILAVIVLSAAIAFTPDGLAHVTALVTAYRSGQFAQPEALQTFLAWPPFVILALLVFSLLTPLVEELVKPIGVAVRLIARPAAADPGVAFLLGALAGAGFALFEGPLNTLSGSDMEWWTLAVLRAGATLLHAFNAALVAWGWARLVGRREWHVWLGALAGALVLHAAWNGFTILIAPTGAAAALGLTCVCFGVLSAISGGGLIAGAWRLRVAELVAPEPAAAPSPGEVQAPPPDHAEAPGPGEIQPPSPDRAEAPGPGDAPPPPTDS